MSDGVQFGLIATPCGLSLANFEVDDSGAVGVLEHGGLAALGYRLM